MQLDSGGNGAEIDFDLNLAPIIDCFTVLITFLLISASYISIHILETSVTSVEVSTDPIASSPGISLSVLTKHNDGFDIIISGNENKTISVPSSTYALTQLEQVLSDILSQWKDTKILTVSGEDGVEYKDIVRVIEMGGKHFSTILIGGF